MHEKECKKCKNNKSISEFYKAKNKKSGYQSYCKQCLIEINKIKYKQNPEVVKHRTKEREIKIYDLLNKTKKYYGCYYCDEYEPCCLDFHHLNPNEKEGTISNFVSQHNVEKIVKEINKCILVCANCHRKIHHNIIIINLNINIDYGKFNELLNYNKRNASVV